MPLATTVATSLDDLAALAPEWDELARSLGAPLFSRPFWCLPWARHLSSGRPHVVAVRDGSDLLGVAPVAIQSAGPVQLVRFLGHGLGAVTSFLHPSDRPDVAESLWAAVLGDRRRFAQLLEQRAPRSGPVVPQHWPARVQPRDTCLTVACSGDIETYLQTRPKKLRENLRRAERALAADDHSHEIELVTDAGRWREVRPEAIRVFDAAEAAQPRQPMFGGPFAGFTDDFLLTSAETGRLRLFLGRVDGEAVSLGIAFVVDGTLSYWITRFDPRFAHASVGVLLLRGIIAHGFEAGLDQVDLLLGDQGHKRRWSTGSYDTLTVLTASHPGVLRLGAAALTAAERVRRR